MCGRFSFIASQDEIKNLFGWAIQLPNPLPISYNIAPTQQALVLTNTAPQKLQFFKWGLIPSWAKDTKSAGRLINARSETIVNKPSFKVPVLRQRCLVLADSFYEWRSEGNIKKPFRIFSADQKILAFAGIWDVWKKRGETVHSFSIITTDANKEMKTIHNRMPAILETSEQQGRWLADLSQEETLEMLQIPRDGLLKYYRVSTSVNSVRNNGKHLHDEVNDDLLTLF